MDFQGFSIFSGNCHIKCEILYYQVNIIYDSKIWRTICYYILNPCVCGLLCCFFTDVIICADSVFPRKYSVLLLHLKDDLSTYWIRVYSDVMISTYSVFPRKCSVWLLGSEGRSNDILNPCLCGLQCCFLTDVIICTYSVLPRKYFVWLPDLKDDLLMHVTQVKYLKGWL